MIAPASDRSTPSAPDADALARALHAESFAMRVEPDGRLALLVPIAPDAMSADIVARLRERAWPLARAAGFTHVAIELVAPTDARGGAADERAALPVD